MSRGGANVPNRGKIRVKSSNVLDRPGSICPPKVSMVVSNIADEDHLIEREGL